MFFLSFSWRSKQVSTSNFASSGPISRLDPPWLDRGDRYSAPNLDRSPGSFYVFQFNPHRATADAPVKEMCCKEWKSILERYQRSVQAYSDAVRRLNKLSCVDLGSAWMQAETARKNCEAYRSELFEHEHEHCCRVSPTATPLHA